MGRRRKYCSDYCRVAFHRRQKRATKGGFVPPELVGEKRFVRHIRKRPVMPDGRPSSVTDPATWSTLDQVLASDVGDGIGYVLGGGIGCIDIDDCFDEFGLNLIGHTVLRALPGRTWTEISPSGKGLHVWGLLDEGPGKVQKLYGYKSRIEVYSRDRYITITGQRYKQAPFTLQPLPTSF